MNDVDFLPQWYIENRQRRQSVQRQYVILAALFLVMIVWNSVALRSIKSVGAELSLYEVQQRQAEHVSFEHQRLKGKIEQVETLFMSLAKLDSRVDVAAVLAELSVLVPSPVVLRKMEFVSTPHGQRRVVGDPLDTETLAGEAEGLVQQLAGWAQVNISLQGVADTPAEVAELIRGLDVSPYFSEVHLRYSRHAATGTQVQGNEKTPNAQPAAGAVEFAIDCLLAHIEPVDEA